MVDVVADVKELVRVCQIILSYCWGLPAQKINLDSEEGKAFAFAVLVNPQAEEMLKQMSSEQFKLHFGPTASALILAVSRGLASQILCIGTRGEDKTCTALAAMGAHATEHRKAGHALPVPWAAIMDTFQSHREKTHKPLLKPFWQGAWRLEDGGHKAVLD